MIFQYVLAVLLILAVVVFFYKKINKESPTHKVVRKNRKANLVHSQTGLTMDDHYRLEKKRKELELNDLLDKIQRVGIHNLNDKEKLRLKELSDNI